MNTLQYFVRRIGGRFATSSVTRGAGLALDLEDRSGGNLIEYVQVTRQGEIRRLRRVAEHALAQFGLEFASLTLLAHSFNTTFTVTNQDGGRYVLHIIRHGVDGLSEPQNRARIESELWWMDRVRTDLNLVVPVAVRTGGGVGVVSVPVEGVQTPLPCTLFHWIDGRLVGHRLTPAHLEAVGLLTARLHNHTADLRVPASFDRPTVDPVDAEKEEDMSRLFTDHVSKHAADIVRRVFKRVREAQKELDTQPGTFGLIHADIHQKNYLFNRREVRLIDFGDCGWGHYLYDPAVTVHQLRAVPRRTELRAALLAGYRRVRVLSPAHEAWMDAFVLLREVQDLAWTPTGRDTLSYRWWTTQVEKSIPILEQLLQASA